MWHFCFTGRTSHRNWLDASDNRDKWQPHHQQDTIVLRAPLRPGVPLQMIAVRDIGAVAAAVLLDPSLVPSGAVEIAGDEHTPEQVAQAFGRRLGVAGRFEPIGLGTVADPDSRAMFTWLGDPPAYRADFVTTRRLQPEVAGLETFLAGNRWCCYSENSGRLLRRLTRTQSATSVSYTPLPARAPAQ